MKRGLQPVVALVLRPGTEHIDATRVKCGCVIPFGHTVAQAQRRQAMYRQCTTHPDGPGGNGAPVARRLPRFIRRRNTPVKAPSPAPVPEVSAAELAAREADRRAVERRNLERDRDRMWNQRTAQQAEGDRTVLVAAVFLMTTKCGSAAHIDALQQIERGLRLAERLR